MSEEAHALLRLIKEDPRYQFEAYQFVREALSFGQDNLGFERKAKKKPLAEPGSPKPAKATERHLTGQELCESIRHYALEQYGYMAKVVLNNWGIHSTGDFGEIVYNLIRIGLMKKSESDRREDFENCYSFDEAFQQEFQISAPEAQS